MIFTLCNFIFSYVVYTELIAAQHIKNHPIAFNTPQSEINPNRKPPSIRKSKISLPESIEINKHNSNPCALLFFGVPKLFKEKAYPSIKKHIIDINPCDIFVHTYNITKLDKNERNKEPTSKINVNDIYEMTKNVIMDTDEDFLKARNLTFYRQYFPYSKVCVYLSMCKSFALLIFVTNYSHVFHTQIKLNF